jgi:hypothetical protein
VDSAARKEEVRFRAAAQNAATRTPGAHTVGDRPDHPIAYDIGQHLGFPSELPLYGTPKKWLRMAYCTTYFDGPRIPVRSNGVGQQRWFAVRREWSSLG